MSAATLSAFKGGNEYLHACMLPLLLIMQDKLPPVLMIQMDNTCRDNKNKYMLTFAALLVELGIFRKVQLYCL